MDCSPFFSPVVVVAADFITLFYPLFAVMTDASVSSFQGVTMPKKKGGKKMSRKGGKKKGPVYNTY